MLGRSATGSARQLRPLRPRPRTKHGVSRNRSVDGHPSRRLRDMTYVFPHVPKCGGTSLLKNLQQTGLALFLDYDAIVGPPMHRRNAEFARLDFSPFDVIYGHFPVNRYQGSKYQYVALVRDPIERSISSFHYVGSRASKPSVYLGEMAKRIAAGEVSFLEYLRAAPHARRIYAHFLQYWPRDRFVLVGTTERYGEFLDRLSSLLRVPLSNDIKERMSGRTLELSGKELLEAREILAHEYHWYQAFTRHPAPP